MKMKLAFSLALSLILIISVSSTILLIGTPSPVLGHDSGHGSGDGGGNGGDGGDDGGDGGGNGGDGGGNGGDGGDHGGDGDGNGGDGDDYGGDGDGNGGDGGDGDGNGGDHDPNAPNSLEPDDDYGGNDDYYYDDYEYSEDFLRIEVPEGQELGDVQNVRNWDGTIIVTADGYPVLGRQIFYKNGEPVLDYSEYPEGEPIYYTNTEGWISPPVTYFLELGPGFDSGPGNERFLYTPRPDYWPDDPTQDPPPPGGIPPSERQDDQTQETPSPAPMPGPENQDGELPPSEAFRDNTQFGEPQPVMGPTGNPRVDEDGAPILGRGVLDEEGNPVIGPNGKPIIVIPD